jgi:hypothetical protein
MAESGIATVRMPRLGVRVQPPQALSLLDALQEDPPTASPIWQADPASDGIALEIFLVKRLSPRGAERYSDTAMTC